MEPLTLTVGRLTFIKWEKVKMAKDYTRRELDPEESEDLDKRFTYHPPTDTQKAKTYVELRGMARELGAAIYSTQEASRERSLAITKLEEAIMWANAGIARNT